jgi:hypothetical protein
MIPRFPMYAARVTPRNAKLAGQLPWERQAAQTLAEAAGSKSRRMLNFYDN